jgi:hypothetical protein
MARAVTARCKISMLFERLWSDFVDIVLAEQKEFEDAICCYHISFNGTNIEPFSSTVPWSGQN